MRGVSSDIGPLCILHHKNYPKGSAGVMFDHTTHQSEFPPVIIISEHEQSTANAGLQFENANINSPAG